MTDEIDAAGDVDFGEGGAAVKGKVVDGCYAVWDRDGGEGGAIREFTTC